LRGDHIWIDRGAAIDCADDAVDLNVAVRSDRHFGALRDIGAECFGDRDAAARCETAVPVCLSGTRVAAA
jgi:hypothetical protein